MTTLIRAMPLVSAASDDTELVLAAQRDDEAAFAALYSRHARYVAGVVYRIMGNDGDLDDIVQETFVAAANGIRQLEDPNAVRAWLVTIAVRRVKRHLGRRARRRFFGLQVAELSPQVSDPRDRQRVDDLYDALDHVPADLRVPWALHRIEEVSLPETARICGVSLATVKRRIADAEERIQKRLSL